MLETIGIIFLVTRHDVSQPRYLTSEANEHTYGHCRNILSEFNIEKFICIHNKTNIRNDDIFESGLAAYRYKTTLKGYQNKFPQFIDSLKKAASTSVCYGPLNVDLDMPAVDKLWDTVREVSDSTNTYTELFLKLFSIKKENCLSPLMVEMNYQKDICILVVDLFKPPPKYPCDHPTKNSNSDTSDNGDDNVIVEVSSWHLHQGFKM